MKSNINPNSMNVGVFPKNKISIPSTKSSVNIIYSLIVNFNLIIVGKQINMESEKTTIDAKLLNDKSKPFMIDKTSTGI